MIQNDNTYFYKLPISIQHTWIWNDPEPLYFKWWCDLQFLSSYKEMTLRIGNKIVTLKPGQIVASIDFLVKRWGKSKNMVIRFVKLLIEDGFIKKETKQNVSIITILFNANGSQNDILKDNLEDTQDADKQREICHYTKNLKDNLKDNLRDNPKDNPKDTIIRKQKGKSQNKIIEVYTTSPSTTTPAYAREVLSFEEKDRDNEPSITAVEGVAILKEDENWLLQIQRKFALEKGMIIRWLDSFCVDCDCRGKQQHENLADVKQHFNDWLPKMLSSKGNKKTCKGEGAVLTPEQSWLRCQAEWGKSVTDDVARRTFASLKFSKFDPKTSVLLLSVPNRQSYEFVEKNLIGSMTPILQKHFGRSIILKYQLPSN